MIKKYNNQTEKYKKSFSSVNQYLVYYYNLESFYLLTYLRLRNK